MKKPRNVTLHAEQANALNAFQRTLSERLGFALTLHQTVQWLLVQGHDAALRPVTPVERDVFRPTQRGGRPRKRIRRRRNRIVRELIAA